MTDHELVRRSAGLSLRIFSALFQVSARRLPSVYASITTIGLEESRVREFIAFYERLLPILKDVKGCPHLYLLVNRNRGQGQVLAF